MFINVNTHSYYSLLESTLSLDDIISFAKNNNQEYVFLTDSNLYGSIEFSNKCISENLIPIIGLDIFFNNNKLIIFPTSNNGYKNLIKISSNILQKNNFNINDYLNDTLVIFDGNKINEINAKYFFTTNTNKDTDININEARYINDDMIMLDIMNAIKLDQKIDLSIKRNHNKKILLNNEFINIYSNNTWINQKEFITLVTWKKDNKKNEIISFPLKENISSRIYLKQICEEFLKNISIENKDINIYKERLNHELNIINEMGFNDYFLIVHDFINEAKNRDILIGPGRGSSPGSLVSFLLSITKIDPIKYGLIFERFLNPNRYSLPDIDIDIMDTRRDEIIEYIFNKYGYDHVAHIITFQRIKSKMAIRDVGRVLNIDLKMINRISKLIKSEYDNNLLGAVESSKELKNFYDNFTDLFIYANKLIGIPRQTGLHAAGIVLSKEKLTDVIPLQYSANDLVSTQISMEYLESMGLIKMDLLGLSNLTIIQSVIKLINSKNDFNISLDNIPLNDKNVFIEISKGNTMGIFQLESPGMRNTLKKVKPKDIEDISLVSALFRPGPQKNIPTFVERRFSNEKIDFIDDRIKDILLPTNGIIVYQEQVIEIAKRVASFSSADADIFRKAMSKKNPEEMLSLKNKFINSSIKNNYSKEISEKIFDYIEKFASYGFNHCHSISYALISYWMVYLKIKYPLFFMSVLLKYSENSSDKIFHYCNEVIRMKLKINKPDINISSKSFKIYNNIIYFGFSAIKGIGNETSKKIINIRNEEKNKKFNNYEECISLLSKNGIGEPTIETLIYSGSFDSFGKTKKFMIENLKEAIDASKNITKDGDYLFSPNWEEFDETSDDIDNFIKKEVELIGFNFYEKNNDEFNNFAQKFPDKNFDTLTEINNGENGRFYNAIVKILNVNVSTTKFGKEMAFIKIADNTSTSRFACFNYSFLKDKISESNYVIATIKINDRGGQIIDIQEVNNE